MSPTALTLRTKLLYGFGSVAYGVRDQGFGFLLLLYYNQVLGLPERWVGLGIMVALVADGLLDPLVGYLSDHVRSRWGRRHPFMYASALPVAGAYYVLWTPPTGLSSAALFSYFVVLVVLVRVFLSLYEIPSASLAPELTDQYDQRTSMLSYRFFFGWWGGLTMSVLAFAVFLQPDAAHPVGVLNPDGYRRYGLVGALVMAAAILVSAIGTHRHIPHLRQPSAQRALGLRGIVREVGETLSNRSFLALFGAGFFSAMAGGFGLALGIYFNTFFWALTSNEIALLSLVNFPSAIAALVVTPRLSTRYGGKKPAALRTAIAACVLGPATIVLRLVGFFPPNHSPALLPILLIGNAVVVTLLIIANILVASMVADVVEDSELTTGRRSEGLFFAANSLMQKSVSGVGIFGSTLLLSAVGFPRGATPGQVEPTVVRNLGLVYVPVIMLLYVGTLSFLSAYRISRATHEANLERLAQKRTG